MTNIVFVFKTLIEALEHYFDYGRYFKCTRHKFVFKLRYIILSGFIKIDMNC